MPLFFDVLTGLTICSILAILVLYVLVVYKKGWLKGGSNESEPHFLCPNPECRKVFKEPVWLTDLSKTPPESFQSCPHCGENLETSSSPGVKKSPEPESTIKPSHFLRDFKKSSEGASAIQKESVPKRMETTREFSRSSLQTNTFESSEKSADSQEPKTLVKTPEIRKVTPTESTETPKRHEVKKLFQSSRTCSHFFGYVRTLPKKSPFPDECLGCPQLLKCLKAPRK